MTAVLTTWGGAALIGLGFGSVEAGCVIPSVRWGLAGAASIAVGVTLMVATEAGWLR